MKKFDRLGWAEGFVFISHGVRVGVRVDDADILGEVALKGVRGEAREVVDVLRNRLG